MRPVSPHLNIELCLGSSCYCRGNGNIRAGLPDLIARQGWHESVDVKGCLCRESCAKGPMVFLNGSANVVHNITELEKLIETELHRMPCPPVEGGQAAAVK